MQVYFQYIKKQRTVAYTILFNAVLLLAMYMALVRYLPQFNQSDATDELLYVASIAVWPIELILLSLAIYYYINNKAFVMKVTSSEFYYYDPTFTELVYRIPMVEIVAIEQFTDPHRTWTTNHLVLTSGERRQLMYGNFNIDRNSFFKALKRANPNIVVPENPYRYKMRRPNWATKFFGSK